MSEKIEPALTPEQWKIAHTGAIDVCGLYYQGDGAMAIAIINAELPDTDPRKITREWIQHLRTASDRVEDLEGDGTVWRALDRIADALQSYLPPETP
jgi:hypothetical protein